MVITDESIGVSQLLGPMPGPHPQRLCVIFRYHTDSETDQLPGLTVYYITSM